MNTTKEWLEKYKYVMGGQRPESVRRLMTAFDGTIVNKPEDAPLNDIVGISHPEMACYCCKQTDRWIDRYGNSKCQRCHPKPLGVG
jgi:hypothetical protein